MALEFHQKLIMFLFNFLKAFKSHCVQTLTGLRLGGTLEWQHEKLHAHGQTASPQFTHTHTHTHPRKHSVLCPSFCPPPLHYFIHPPVSHEEHLLQGCGASAHKKKEKKLLALMMEKPTPKKAREKKCSRKKVLSWKASIFLSLWALGPGTEHPWMPESFIIWQLGSAVQFYLLAGGKRSTARSPHSQREIKTGRDGDKERVKKSGLSCKKQPPESSMATHGAPAFFILLLHLSPPFASFSDVL